MNFLRLNIRKRIIILSSFILLFTGFLIFPIPKFNRSYSTVLEDRNGKLLGAAIAEDGQWRFPETDSVPLKFQSAILLFEDKYFYSHPGFNPVSILRAFYLNIKAGKVLQGGSTLTMQTVRLSRNNPARTVFEKFIEVILALRLELGCSKKEILSLYASHAPFGGNVVGIEAASWRYFSRKPSQLSWGESALLAVLPNSPSLIYPGKNHQTLLLKRNRLLRKLFNQGKIDKITCELAELEPLPLAPTPLPRYAAHAMDKLIKEGNKGRRLKTSIDLGKQVKSAALLQYYSNKLSSNSIHNGAILILDVGTGKVVAYVGNTQGKDQHLGFDVDLVTSKRSYGSLFKPMLYAAMLEEGTLLPRQMVPDVPVNISGYKPQNFFKDYDGVVPANEVLSRSLNVPSVRLLHEHGVPRFMDLLVQCGITTLDKPGSHYGLSLILGGGEATLWEMTGMYASLARTALLRRTAFTSPQLFLDSTFIPYKHQPGLSPASAWFTLQAIAESKRPGNEGEWLQFPSAQKISWKTGTSYGSRDAWAIGVTSRYAIGVWLGNASGEGRAGLTGIGTAAPLLFDVFDLMEKSTSFPVPISGMTNIPICQKSGYKASRFCINIKEESVPASANKSGFCPYHQLLHLSKKGERVTSNCMNVNDMQHKNWFILPALHEFYYKPRHPDYISLPAWDKNCIQNGNSTKNMDIIYPKRFTHIFIPREITGRLGMTVFEAAHREPGAIIYWHIDDSFLTQTSSFHQVSVQLEEGWHTLSLVDNAGESMKIKFEVLSKK